MAKSRKRQPNRRSDRKLAYGPPPAVAGPGPWHIPRSWLNTWIALFLLPLVWLFGKTFFHVFSRTTLHDDFWMTDEFWFFGLGSVLWTLCFFGTIWASGEPRPLRVYVFGHELTHAIWVWLCGGRVSEFKVTRTGGYIYTDTHNVWVALSPYFYPVYSMAVVLCYGVASVFYEVARTRATLLWLTPLQWMFLLLGLTWAFHLSFTVWMIPKGQSDLTRHGTIYSLIFILLMNILVLTVFLVVAAPEISWFSYGEELYANLETMLELAGRPFGFHGY